MSFPDPADTNSGFDDTSTTSHSVSLPANIASGNLLIIFITSDTFTATASASGWTSLYSTASGILSRGYCLYKVADGSEGSAVTVTFSANCTIAWSSYRITSFQGTPEAGTPATGSSASPNPPSLTPSWGADDDLWLVAAHCINSTSDLAAPTNYTGLIEVRNTALRSNGTAYRQLNATSEDPGTFSNANNTEWTAGTVAVRGVATTAAAKMHSYKLRRAA